MTYLGKARGMQLISDQAGTIQILALDHRESFKRLVAASATDTSYENVVAEKLRIINALGGLSSALLLDPVLGAIPALSVAATSAVSGLVLSLDDSGYAGDEVGRISRIIPGFSVAKAKRMGAAAVKIMVYHHPDSPVRAQQEELVALVSEQAQVHDIAFVLEPVTHAVANSSPVGSAEYETERARAIIETAVIMDGFAADVLKVEFPGKPGVHSEAQLTDFCAELNDRTTRPWIVLSGGTDFATCQTQVEIACRNGASGYAIGRTIWQDAVTQPGAQARDEFLNGTSAMRVEVLSAISRRLGAPYWNRIPAGVSGNPAAAKNLGQFENVLADYGEAS